MEKQFIDSIMPIVEKYITSINIDDFGFIENDSKDDLNSLIAKLDALLKTEFKKSEDEIKLKYIRSLFRKVFSSIKHHMSAGIDEAGSKKDF